jgi:hypothetical protein
LRSTAAARSVELAWTRGVQQLDMDLRPLNRIDDGRPLGVWDRIEHLHQRGHLGGQHGDIELPPAVSRVLALRKASMDHHGIDNGSQDQTEADCDHNRQGDPCRDAIETPPFHVAAPSSVTGAAKT